MSDPYTKGAESITQGEHISPEKTGDNIQAKRVANYEWDGAGWKRQAAAKLAGVDYDYIDVQQTSTTIDTFVYKLGGSGGTTVRTIVVTYTSTGKTDIDTIAYS